MRVDPRTRAASTLEQFLLQYDLPIITYLRDTKVSVSYTQLTLPTSDPKVYVYAAFNGKSIFDLPFHQAEQELTQWKTLTQWVKS